MASVWKKTLSYLGLVEDEEDMEGFEPEDAGYPEQTATVRQFPTSRSMAATQSVVGEPTVRTITAPRPTAGAQIHKAEPKRFNEARELGDRFKDGVPVIMNLQGTEDAIARRLVDFASGLVFGLDGKIEMVANRVYLLTPADVEVSAEERERIREGGLYNQF